MKLLLTLLLVATMVEEFAARQLPALTPCGHDRVAEVIKGKKDNIVTCYGLSSGKHVDWNLQFGGRYPDAVGYCPDVITNQPCSPGSMGMAFVPERVADEVSMIIINPTLLGDHLLPVQEGRLMCFNRNSPSTAWCDLDYIVPAKGNCSVGAGTRASPFHLAARCDIEAGASSHRGRYLCKWLQRGPVSSTFFTRWFTEINGEQDCVVYSRKLPTVTGKYYYTVILVPGRIKYALGTLDITRE
ncbi:uncharacterized protein LOC143280666 isoform X2 [Babylonia areolata]|uniref:uncharacterized protein LOC143280666 isoform X2 n=1 Tax=Babylonia areolata TaxID=304850 RepID=UPI003FD0005E